MELILKSAEVNLPQEIENLEQLKAELTPMLDKYSKIVVTEESIKSAKADKANLNKLKKAIDSQRIAIKKQYLEPYTLLENQCKEVISLINAPIQAIDKQLKAFEEVEKQDKLAKLKAAFLKLTPPVWCGFERILPEKWTNRTEPVEKIESEIVSKVLKIKAEFSEIQSIYKDKPYLIAVLNTYQKTLSKSETIEYALTLESQTLTEPPLNTPVSHASESNTTIPANSEKAVDGKISGNSGEVAERIVTGCFKVSGTAAQIKALGDFMRNNGIKYEAIKI